MTNQPPVVVLVIGDIDPDLTSSLVQTLKSHLGIANHTVLPVADACVTFQEFHEFCRVWRPDGSTEDQVRAYAYRGWNALLAKIPEIGAVCTQCDQRWGVCRCPDKGKLYGRTWLYYDRSMNGPGAIMRPSSWDIPFASLSELTDEQWSRIHPASRERLQRFVNFARSD